MTNTTMKKFGHPRHARLRRCGPGRTAAQRPDRARLPGPGGTCNDARFVLPQGYGSPDDFATTLKRAFDVYWEEGEERPRMMSVGLHPRLVGQAARIAGLRDFLEYALDKGGVWFARRIDIARWWIDHHEEFEA